MASRYQDALSRTLLAVAAALAVLASPAVARSPVPNSATWRENQRPGTWNWDARQAPGETIQGYGSQISVVAGQTLDLHVATRPAARYRVQVYRLGWYAGAGARLIACDPSCGGSRRGRPHPGAKPNPRTGEVSVSWPVTDRIRTGRSWVSGEYIAQLRVLTGRHAGEARWVPFIVRSARPSPDSILVQVPVNTWEAYNNWGAKSLYTYNSSHQVAAVEVSFNRPFGGDRDDEFTFPIGFEYPLLQFLERSGFPLEYATDVDVDEHPQLLLAHRLSITIGHGEYWSAGMRAAWDAARDAGRNLAFLGSDTAYWQIRYADRHRAIIEYRSASLDPDPVPAQKTTAFRDLEPPLPECQLLGVQFQWGGLQAPYVGSYTVVDGAYPWVAEAGLYAGESLHNVIRGEWDSIQPGCTNPAPTVLFQYSGAAPADATVMSTPAGGRVFALGTEGFGTLVDGWRKTHCSVDIHAERFLRIALSDLDGLTLASLPPLGRACLSERRHR